MDFSELITEMSLSRDLGGYVARLPPQVAYYIQSML